MESLIINEARTDRLNVLRTNISTDIAATVDVLTILQEQFVDNLRSTILEPNLITIELQKKILLVIAPLLDALNNCIPIAEIPLNVVNTHLYLKKDIIVIKNASQIIGDAVEKFLELRDLHPYGYMQNTYIDLHQCFICSVNFISDLYVITKDSLLVNK